LADFSGFLARTKFLVDYQFWLGKIVSVADLLQRQNFIAGSASKGTT
jgi:hypothetical protein